MIWKTQILLGQDILLVNNVILTMNKKGLCSSSHGLFYLLSRYNKDETHNLSNGFFGQWYFFLEFFIS